MKLRFLSISRCLTFPRRSFLWYAPRFLGELRRERYDLVADLRAGASPGRIAARFHNGLARAVLEACRAVRRESGIGQVALSGGNLFGELMHTVRFCSLGQITQALYAVGGQYRRNM